MSTITSLTTLAEIRTELMRTASYEEDASAEKARAFITACRALMAVSPSAATEDGQSLANDKAHYREEMKLAREWLARYGQTPTPTGSGALASGLGARVRVPEAFR